MATLDSPEAIYEHVFDALPMQPQGDWIEIHLHAHIDESSVGLIADYRTADGRKLDLDVRKLDHSVSKAIHDLRPIMSGSGQWTRAHFTLKRSGEYAVQFE